MPHFIIDALNLAYRCHHAQPGLTTSKGEPTGMFFGFIQALVSQKKKFRNFKFVVVWDNKSKRKYLVQPDYKAGRSKLPPIVYNQVNDLKTFLENVGIDQYEKEGEEADDIIATLATVLKGKDLVYILTNDKDMLQLVEDGKIIVIKPKVGNNEEKYYDEEAVKQQFGVPPKLIPVYLSFCGDPSDNIKGVPRMPTKLVCRLASTYESVEAIYASLDKENLTENKKSSILEHKSKIMDNEKLVRLVSNLSGISSRKGKPDLKKTDEILKKYEIKKFSSESVVGVLSNTPNNIRFSEPKSITRIESYSLFD